MVDEDENRDLPQLIVIYFTILYMETLVLQKRARLSLV